MYAASAKFHESVYGRNPSERILITMPELCLTSEDLSASGLTFTEALNSAEELTIGECPSSTLAFKVFNGHGLLSEYPFVSECAASIGIRTETQSGAAEMPYAILRYNEGASVTFRGHDTEPYLTVNGETPLLQPPFPVKAIAIDGRRVYCIGEGGEVWAVIWRDGSAWDELAANTWGELSDETWNDIQGYIEETTVSVIPFMRAKFTKWAAQKRGVWRNGFTSYEFGEAIEKYEYVPLGKFLPDQPKKRRVTQIAFTASDRMMLFERDSTEFLDSLAYPITIGEVLARLCAYIGVTLATPTFINSTRELAEPLFASEAVTCREVLGWIAEAAGAYARMTRDGELELAWFGAEAVEIPMEQYFDIDIAEYQVAPIDKLQILGSDTDIGVIIGEGTNGYQIMDNPYLYGGSDAEIRPLGVPIYNRLAAFAAFSPIKARAVCDWAIQAGDVIGIALNGVNYRLPIYRQTVTWNGGGARVSYESTGAASRPVMSAANRRVFNQKRAIHELEVTVDGFSSRIEDVEGGVLDLEATAQGLALEVSKKVGDDEIIASINASAEEVAIQAEKIKFEGAVTANNYFKINTDGSMTATNATITGKITATSGSFTGSVYASSGTIGGFTISGSNLVGSYIQLQPTITGGRILLGNLSMEGMGNALHLNGNVYPQNGDISIGYVSQASEVSIVPYGSGVGNVGVGNQYWNQVKANSHPTASSIRYKRNIVDISDADVGDIDDIRPIIYELINKDDGKKYPGFIAEELADTAPLFVSYDEEGLPESIDYSRIVVLLVYEVKKMRKRISALEEAQ